MIRLQAIITLLIKYWDACVQIDKLKMVLYTVFCSAQPTPEEFNIVLNHETGRAEIS